MPLAVAQTSTRPAGFQESVVTTALTAPTSMAITPDGRIFVTQQAGRIRVIKNGILLATSLVALTVDASQSRGLLGLALDPDFATNGYIYVYYTATSPAPHNRISRLTVNGDVAVAGSEVVLFELDTPSNNSHNGGALQVGPDGKLYQTVGDDNISANGPSLAKLFGKVLRLNRDGTIPTDNPFYNTTTGKYRAIWAYGLRNPFTIAFQPGTGRMYVHDVGTTGAAAREEINEGVAGANYGYPSTEGYTSNPGFKSPFYAYAVGPGFLAGCAAVGGAFYHPAVNQFPSEYAGAYFFADHCNGWINYFKPGSGNTVINFATGIAGGDRVGTLDIDIGPDGSLYYLLFNGGLYKIFYGSGAPSLTRQPASQTVTVGRPVTFTVSATGDEPLSYQWQRNEVNISGATSTSYSIASAATSDHGARFRCRVSNPLGTTNSNTATLTVTTNNAPAASITSPAAMTLYHAGTTINYSGNGTDPENGTLPASAFTWWIDFHHNTHLHPFMAPTTGSRTGSFNIPNNGDEKATDVWYRIYLKVTDSGGLSTTVFRDINPRLSTITLTSNPSGRQVTIDGLPRTTPHSFPSVVGMIWSLGVISPQTANGTTYQFQSWSDAGSAVHNITTQPTNTTYTATFRAATAATCRTVSASGTTWSNNAFSAHSGTLTAEWDMTPLASGINGVVGLSSGTQTNRDNLATRVRFNTSGVIDARNGSTYAATNRITYRANTVYHIRLVANVATRRYTVYVRPAGGVEQLLAQNYAFSRSVTSLNNWALNATTGSIRACGFTLSP